MDVRGKIIHWSQGVLYHRHHHCYYYYYHYYYYYYCYYYYYHNYNKILKSDWLSTALISALIGQFNWTVRVMPK